MSDVPFLLAHISDLHIAAGRQAGGHVRADAVGRARALVADLAAFRPAIGLVVITGDLTDGGTAQDYALLREVLAPLGLPVVLLPGNHDARAPMHAAFPEVAFAAPDMLCSETKIGPVRVLGLDTLVEGEVAGRLDARQLGWLEGKLNQRFAGPTVIALHHPPCPANLGALDRNGLTRGAEALLALIEAAPGPVTVLCGHVHRPFIAHWGKATVFAAASTAFEYALALDADTEPGLSTAAYGYRLHLFDAAGGRSVHRVLPDLSPKH